MTGITLPDRDRYVQRLLDLYRHIPGTIGKVRPADRELAAKLWARGITLELVETAFLLAAARRTNRPENTPPLPPIRSLHYFQPVIDELIAEPLPETYRQYLTGRVTTQTTNHDGDSPDHQEQDPP